MIYDTRKARFCIEGELMSDPTEHRSVGVSDDDGGGEGSMAERMSDPTELAASASDECLITRIGSGSHQRRASVYQTPMAMRRMSDPTELAASASDERLITRIRSGRHQRRASVYQTPMAMSGCLTRQS
jgi:hypothetical protein